MGPASNTSITERVSDLLDQAATRLRGGVDVDEAALAVASAKSLLSALTLASSKHGVHAPVELHQTIQAFPRWAVVLQERHSQEPTHG